MHNARLSGSDRFSGIVGQDYDLFFSDTYPHNAEFEERIASVVPMNKPISVIDLGSGTGITTREILKKNPSATIHCIDTSSTMLEQAESYFKRINAQNVHFYLHDALDALLTIIEPGSVDAIVTGSFPHNCPAVYRRPLIAASYAVLRGGGLISIGDKIAYDDPALQADAFNWSIERFIQTGRTHNCPVWAYDWIKHMVEDEARDVQWNESHAIADLKDAKFRNVSLIYRNHMEAVIVGYKQ